MNPRTTPSTTRARLWRLLLALATVGIVGACGGGDSDEESEPPAVPPLDCKARPELCR
jgi:hypothetical protein